MRTKMTIAAATAALATGGIAAAGAGATASSTNPAKAPSTASAAATRHVEGRVTAIDRAARTFTVRDTERGTLKVKVTSNTRFERVTFSSLRTGSRVDVRAKRVAGAWNATKVERARGRSPTTDGGLSWRRTKKAGAADGGHRRRPERLLAMRFLLLAAAATALLAGGAAATLAVSGNSLALAGSTTSALPSVAPARTTRGRPRPA